MSDDHDHSHHEHDHGHQHPSPVAPEPLLPEDAGSRALSEALHSSFAVVKVAMVVLAIVF